VTTSAVAEGKTVLQLSAPSVQMAHTDFDFLTKNNGSFEDIFSIRENVLIDCIYLV
jgi:hypothetical protein